MNVFENDRSIYDVFETSRYPEDTVDGYDYNPVIGKTSVWNKLGDTLSSLEKVSVVRNEGQSPAQKFFTLRLDGHSFSKRMPLLKRLNIFGQGYSLEFENIMKKITASLLSSIQCSLYAFTQSDEIVVLVKPCDVDEHGNYVNYEFRRRRDKLVSVYASMATNIFTREVMRLVLENMRRNPELEFDVDSLPDIQFDARIAEYDTLADAFQMVLWRSFDCSVNGVSSGFVFNSFENKKKLMTMNSGEKLKVLQEHGLLSTMTRHQLYGSFMYFEFDSVELPDGRVKRKRRVVTMSEQLVKLVKDGALPVPYR